MDPTSNWNELFQRLSKEITVIPISGAQGAEHNQVEAEYFNHVVNPKVLQQPCDNNKPSDSTGASVMSLPLVFPLDPPQEAPVLPRGFPLLFGSQRHFLPPSSVHQSQFGSANTSDSNANSFRNECEVKRETVRQSNENGSQPRANVFVGTDGKTMFSCTKCDLQFNLPNEFQEHWKQHINERPYAPRANLFVGDDGKTVFSCTRCELQFSSAIEFQDHWKIHVNERPYICDECGLALKRKEHLERHRSAHTSERPHQCPQCDKKFKRSEHLSRHIITHAEIKPYVCPLCFKGFSRKDHLNKHATTHCIRSEAESEQKKYFSEMQTWDQDLVQRMEKDNPFIKQFHNMLQQGDGENLRDFGGVKIEGD